MAWKQLICICFLLTYCNSSKPLYEHVEQQRLKSLVPTYHAVPSYKEPTPPSKVLEYFKSKADIFDFEIPPPEYPGLPKPPKRSYRPAPMYSLRKPLRDSYSPVPSPSPAPKVISHISPSLVHRPPKAHFRNPHEHSLYTSGHQAEKCWLEGIPKYCDASAPYRTADGSCNNIKHPNWGRSKQLLGRFMPPKYDYGDMRSLSVTGAPLPSPRKITTTITRLATHADFDQKLTSMHMLWGQFIDHDISHTPLVSKVKCCDIPEYLRSYECIPIQIPEHDPFWGRQHKTCMELRRSLAIKAGQCGEKYRQQVNNLTSYIDGGAVYGNTEDRAKELRTFYGGQLRMSPNDLLPVDKPTTDCMIPFHGHPDKRCFATGDKRTNVWSGLTSVHTVWLREHNRIAHVFYNKLRQRQPYMSEGDLDERVYQETRRVIGALLQVVTYSEYLPNVLGESIINQYGLNFGAKTGYDPKINPTTANVFAAAAFRFGHSEIPFGTQPKTESFTNSSAFIPFEDTFNQPAKYRAAGQENSLRGVCSERALKYGNGFSPAIRDKLFAKSFNGSGLDLIAVNIQRARDHGIQSYNSWRSFCGLSKVTSFYHMPDHTYDLQKKFAQVYEHPDDIDLYIGAITENLVDYDAHIGPTFACILAEQFKRLKVGDRFWFENQGTYANSFSTKQIEQLKRVKLAKIICHNSNTEVIAEDVFKMNSRKVNCDDLHYLDLWRWLN